MMGLENPQKCVKKDKIPSPPDLLLSLPTLYYLGAKHSSVSWAFYWKMIIYPPWNQQIASEIREGLFTPSDQAKPETTRFPPFQHFFRFRLDAQEPSFLAKAAGGAGRATGGSGERNTKVVEGKRPGTQGEWDVLGWLTNEAGDQPILQVSLREGIYLLDWALPGPTSRVKCQIIYSLVSGWVPLQIPLLPPPEFWFPPV